MAVVFPPERWEDHRTSPTPGTQSKGTNMTRTAIITGGADSIEQVQAYMPGNYSVTRHYVRPIGADRNAWVLIITGQDEAGWTLDGYVIPRLASGLIFAEEVGA